MPGPHWSLQICDPQMGHSVVLKTIKSPFSSSETLTGSLIGPDSRGKAPATFKGLYRKEGVGMGAGADVSATVRQQQGGSDRAADFWFQRFQKEIPFALIYVWNIKDECTYRCCIIKIALCCCNVPTESSRSPCLWWTCFLMLFVKKRFFSG